MRLCPTISAQPEASWVMKAALREPLQREEQNPNGRQPNGTSTKTGIRKTYTRASRLFSIAYAVLCRQIRLFR